MQIFTNYETHIFKKWGAYPHIPSWLRQWRLGEKLSTLFIKS